MAFSITIKMNAGSIQATAVGDFPDGEIEISGVEQPDGFITLLAEQRDELGHHVIRAQHYYRKGELEHLVRPAPATAVLQPDDDHS